MIVMNCKTASMLIKTLARKIGGNTMKRLSVIFVICLLVQMIMPVAMAETAYYCPVCLDTTNWDFYCTGEFAYNSGYSEHKVSGEYCNYYTSYVYTARECTGCGNDYAMNTSHAEFTFHDICNHEYNCPY